MIKPVVELLRRVSAWPEQPPRSNDLDRGVDQQDLPVRQQRLERPCPDGHRQQQQSAESGPAKCDNQRIKISYSDPNEEVGNAPARTEGGEEQPPTTRHNSTTLRLPLPLGWPHFAALRRTSR